MLSIEIPPGPSCPCKPSELRADDSTCETVGLGEAQATNFSIREYVFKSRGKDISVNWPFPQHLLQTCLKHGIRDVLPPFEPPDPVRISSQFESLAIKDVGPVDDKTCIIGPETCMRSDELEVDRSEKQKVRVDRVEISDNAAISEGNAETASAVTNQDLLGRVSYKPSELCCSDQVLKSVSEESLEIEAAALHPLPSKFETFRNTSERKCRSLVKLSSFTEIKRTEDIVSTSSTVSDPMASKVCPVCKLFASTSNTTLNAHIDQCLSTDYNIKCDDKKIEKPKVKPAKKRLMVDIYATSSPSTLEDLDRRNGTNWAVELAFTARTSEACSTEFKRPKHAPVVTRDDDNPVEASEDGNEGAVYVDSNGIKLRILSKFKDIPPVMPREQFKLKKDAKKRKEDKSLSISKERCFGSKYSKYMKVKSQTKKVSSFKSLNGEIQGDPDGDYDFHTDMDDEESPSEILRESRSEISSTPDQIKSCGTMTLRRWVCSKRSDLPKKLNHKDINNTEKSKLVSTKLFVKRNQPELGNSSVEKSPTLKFSKQSEESTCAPKEKRIDFLSNSVRITGSGKNPKPPVFSHGWSSESTSTNGLMLKISRSPGTPNSSPGRREEIGMSTAEKSDNSHDTAVYSPESSRHLLMKTRNSLNMKKNALLGRSSFLEESKADMGDKLSTFRKFRKRRSVLGTGKQRESPSDINRGVCHSIKHYGHDAVRTSITVRIPQSDLSNGLSKFSTEEIMDKEFPRSNNISESEDGEAASAMENQKYNTLKRMRPDVQCQDSELVPSDMQAERLSCKDIVTKSSMGKAVGDNVSSEHIAPVGSSKLDPRSSLDVNVHSSCRSDSHSEPSSQKLCDEQAVQYYKATHEEVVSQCIQLSGEGIRGEGYTSAAQYKVGPARTGSVQESSACLTSYEDMILEIPQENSSITSIRRTSGQEPNVVTDRETSGSPVSTASNISPPSLDDSVADLLMRPTVQDKPGLAIRCATNLVGSERTVERRNREAKAFPLTKEPEKISDQPCCCVRNDGLYGQPPFSRQSSLSGRILPCKGKQVSNLYITASASHSLNSYPNSITDAVVIPVLESPTESVTTKASANSAMKGLTCTDFSSPSPSPRTQAQSTSNSILRLMGKNLMVANKEESMQQPMACPVPNTPSNIQCLPSSVSSTNSWECFSYHHRHQLPSGSAVFGQAPSSFRHQMPLHPSNMQVGCFADSLSAGPMTTHDQQIHHNLNRKHNPLSEYNMERPAASQQHPREFMSSSQASVMNEVIVIDDSTDFVVPKFSRPYPISIPPPLPVPNLVQQRPFSCFPSTESHFFPVNGSNGLRLYPNVRPRNYTNIVMQGNISEGPDRLLLPRQMAFHPLPSGHLSSPFYYSQTSQR